MNKFQERINSLWGSSLKVFHFDIANSQVRFVAETLNRGLKREIQFVAIGVSKITYSNSLTEQWDYVELTEIVTKRSQTGWTVKLDLWGVGGLELHCKEIQVDDVPN